MTDSSDTHPRWPEVELIEEDFQDMLHLVDALDPQQLQRLYCKVASRVPVTEVLGDNPDRDTIPPPPHVEEALSEGEYENLSINWDEEGMGTNPGMG